MRPLVLTKHLICFATYFNPKKKQNPKKKRNSA